MSGVSLSGVWGLVVPLHLGVDLVVRLPGGHSESFTPIKLSFFSENVCVKNIILAIT